MYNMTYTIFLMKILHSFQISRDGNRQAAGDGTAKVSLVHVFKCSRRSSFSVVDRLIITIGVTNKSKTTASYARMIHAYHTHA